MEMNIGDGEWVPTMDSKLGLAAVGSGAGKVDRYVIG